MEMTELMGAEAVKAFKNGPKISFINLIRSRKKEEVIWGQKRVGGGGGKTGGDLQ